jgi:hypothetical protein
LVEFHWQLLRYFDFAKTVQKNCAKNICISKNYQNFDLQDLSTFL